MASIVQVRGRWRALVRRKGHPTYCQTWDTKAQAERWARGIEASIDVGKAPAAAAVIGRVLLLGSVIREYRRLRAAHRPILDTSNTHYMLKTLERELGGRDALTLAVDDLVGYCRLRSDEGAGPYTLNMEISMLGTVLRHSAGALKVVLPDVVGQARPMLHHFGLIGAGGVRERRPTEDELAAILVWLTEHKGGLFADIARWAAVTAMRQSEICRMRWSDVDDTKRTLLIRERKNPRKKQDEHIPLLADAWSILSNQQRGDPSDLVFPIGAKTVSRYFTEACKALAIVDLHFHDLRHDGVSRLFEAGYEIQQVALVSGHKDWRNLKRYTNLKPEGLHAIEAAKLATNNTDAAQCAPTDEAAP